MVGRRSQCRVEYPKYIFSFAEYPVASGLRSRSGYFGGVGKARRINFPEKRGLAAIILYYQNMRVNRLAGCGKTISAQQKFDGLHV